MTQGPRGTASGELREVDPFDLPDWLGTAEVTWAASCSLRPGPVAGELRSAEGALPCDLLGVDLAFPRPVVPEAWRQRAHQFWARGEVLLLERDDRLLLAAPGTQLRADDVLEVVGRFAKAVGVGPETYVVALRP